MMTGFGMGFGWLGLVFMAIFWILLIAAAVWFFSNLFPRPHTSGSGEAPESALSILNKRYARGEINKEEYETMRRDIDK